MPMRSLCEVIPVQMVMPDSLEAMKVGSAGGVVSDRDLLKRRMMMSRLKAKVCY